MQRVFLFIITNIAILAMISLLFSLTGFQGVLDEQGADLNLQALLVLSAIVGGSGSFISLAISKWTAKRATGAQVITDPSTPAERWLHDRVQRHALAAGIHPPELAIFDSPAPNAFATGMRKNAALVAVSTGLLQNMNEQEVDAVLGHEIGHVANGDMVTLALVQGVVNTFIFFLSRVIGHYVDRVVFRNERGYGIGYFAVSIAAQIALGILAMPIVMWFSRKREFKADAEGARLAGREAMIAALRRLGSGQAAAVPLPQQLDAFGIAGGGGPSWKALFSSHPPIEERIAALQRAA